MSAVEGKADMANPHPNVPFRHKAGSLAGLAAWT